MSEPIRGTPPFRVVYSERCREEARRLLMRAHQQGRFAEIADTMLGIDTRLKWIPLDFGEPFQNLVGLGLQRYTGVLPPLVVSYGVDEARRIVYVTVPFKLLPRSGL